MKSPSLDTLYTQINKHILLAQSYTEINELAFIIKSCRLKPYLYVFEDKDKILKLHKWWFDEFGNSLKIDKNKRIKLTYNDLSLKIDKINSTDLYYGLSINKIAKISKLAHCCFGKDEDLYENCAIITFMGLDNYLRSYMLLYGRWQQISPLLLGIHNLKVIAQNIDIKYFHELKNKENVPAHCISAGAWLTFMPPSKEFLTLLNKQHEAVYPIFNTEDINI